MKTPSFLLGASLLFWGWQTGLWPLAGALALIVEGSRLVRSKWDLKTKDFNRLVDFCTLLFVVLLVYSFATRRGAGFILVFLQWLPVTFLPILAAQVYGTSDRIDITSRFLTLRRRQKGPKQGKGRSMALNLTYPYFAICILSAAAANWRTPWFYAGLFLLSFWALWPLRSRRYPPVLWAGLLILIGSVGYAGQMGLHRLQLLIEDRTLDWFADYGRKDADPYRGKTSIGDIGSLKPSGRILFRVEGRSGPEVLLLREATYNAYVSSVSSAWFAQHSVFRVLTPDAGEAGWRLGAVKEPGKTVVVHIPLKGGKGMLKLPTGTYGIRGPQALKIVRNQYGAVRVEEGPGIVSYEAQFGSGASFDGPPDKNDLVVPGKEREAISRVAEPLRLEGRSPKETVSVIRTFFQEKFRYSLVLESGAGAMTPLGYFLLKSRSGHCEYFATATVLLLRATGIPARYATGYSVQEYSDMEERFLVREKHAHAWALACLDGIWQNVDTTPASWVEAEGGTASFPRFFSNLWSWLAFKVSAWRWQDGDQGKGWPRHVVWLLVIPILFLARRFRTRGRTRRGKEERKRPALAARPGSDSPFYLIEKRLTDLGHPRRQWESVSDWMQRIEELVPSTIHRETLRSILAVHYRYRFDPQGLGEDERRLLDSSVHSWLEQHGSIDTMIAWSDPT
jgi:hypothetical protein